MLNMNELDLGLLKSLQGIAEPLFVSVTPFDLITRRRLSETFHCEFNDDAVLQLISPHYRQSVSSVSTSNFGVDPDTRLRSAFLSFPRNFCNRVVLLIKVMKVLQGDEDKAAEPYVHPERLV